MHRTRFVLPLALATLVACQAADDPSAALNPVSPALVPSLGATVLKIPNDYFWIYDPEPGRDYTVTFGLVSPVSDLIECGGSGAVFDGGGTTLIVATPSGAVHFRDKLKQATIVYYAGATEDLCELATHPVLARGRGNLRWTEQYGANGSATIHATFGGILDLAAGGRVRLLGVGNIFIDASGNLTFRVDHFDLKPIGH